MADMAQGTGEPPGGQKKSPGADVASARGFTIATGGEKSVGRSSGLWIIRSDRAFPYRFENFLRHSGLLRPASPRTAAGPHRI
jgi:hypothetical protein